MESNHEYKYDQFKRNNVGNKYDKMATRSCLLPLETLNLNIRAEND